MALEQSGETHLVTEVQDLRTTFLNENRCVLEKRLDVLLREVLTAGKSGVAVLEADSDQYNFDFTSSLFFVTTFLTTTGERHSLTVLNFPRDQKCKSTLFTRW